MTQMTRRGFIVTAVAASTLRAGPGAVKGAQTRRILTLVYDKSLGMMRAVERVVP